MLRDLDDILQQHPLLAGLSVEQRALLAGCARNHRFDPGSYLLREGEAASEMYFVRDGRVALEIHIPGRPPKVIATLGDGDLVGASWLVPPYRWQFDARALRTTRAIGVDARCLRAKAEADPAFGYAMMQCFMPVLVARLQAARLQMLDVYARC